MTTLKHFTKDGNTYAMKPQYGFNIVLIAGLFGLAFVSHYTALPILMWIMLALGILSILAIVTKKVIIDMRNTTISIKAGLLRPAARIIPIDNIVNLEFRTVSFNAIRTSTELVVYYQEKGKEKSMIIVQAFAASAVQNIINEMEEIMEYDQR
ncbi:hypothetical protein [Sphingobacterium bambusae]|uniref:DUF304 domain-containing protein n=1 Tax=Sphingobacterium bambusae TaxID=662858 RepID=A0ABW6BIH4_9SPHI|nr:hypothetical protein [Sphingobacterium bambusae]WPL49045.1 hypothetical protein SCB77_01025 [Sphingobacterium bambusae]